MLKIIISVLLLNSVHCLNFCDDWIQYKDTKCLRVLERIGTEEEAVGNCTQLDQSSTLPTIHSKEEQEFLINALNKHNQTSEFAWIGIKYTDKAYKWADSSQMNFENWAKDAVKDGSDPCVQMHLSGTNLGKWIDENCRKTALIVCQKNQKFDLIHLKTALENLTQVIDEQRNEINIMKEQQNEMKVRFIPVGFIYIQLPNQSEPKNLFPNTNWLDVTEKYSGLFFRAEGSGSLPFGQIQSQNQSWISDVHLKGYWFDSWKDSNGVFSGQHHDEYFRSLTQSNWINANGHEDPQCDILAIHNLEFYTTKGEVRPKNTAIKIFKRIE